MPSSVAGFVGGVIGGLVLAAALAATVVAEWPSLRDRLIPPDQSQAAIADLDRRIDGLEASAGRPDPNDAAIAKLSDRVKALELAANKPLPVPAPDPRVATLVDKTDELAKQVAQLRAASGDQADMQQMVTRAEAAAQSAHDAASQRESAEATWVVLGQLRDAIDRGAPYAAELAAARKLAPADATASLDALAATADSGVTPRNILADGLPAVADAITRAALLPPESDGFWQRLERKAATLVSLRRTDGQGSDPASIAARAELAARKGDLVAAVHELEGLDGAPAAAAQQWLSAARARVLADQNLSELIAKMAAAGKDG